MKYMYSFAIAALLFTQTVFSPYAHASSDSVQVELEVQGSCNNNSICEAGEDVTYCASDCGSTPPPSSGGGGSSSGSIATSFHDNVAVSVQYDRAQISWSSSVPTLATVRWGTTSDVSEGTLRNAMYSSAHNADIALLKPGTTYYFSIESEDIYGITRTYPFGTFTTKQLPDTTPPQNVTRVRADATERAIVLTWTPPRDSDFDFVRIMKRESGYTSSPYVGTLVYEGNKAQARDTSIIPGTLYYYVLFTRDTKGNFSSGTGIRVRSFSATPVQTPPVPTPPADPVLPLNPSLMPVIRFMQEGTVLPSARGTVRTNSDIPLTITLEKKGLTGSDVNWVEMFGTHGELLGEYIFSYRADKGVYESAVPALEGEGRYTYRINALIGEKVVPVAEGSIEAQQLGAPAVLPGAPEKKISQYSLVNILLSFALLLFILIGVLFLHRKIIR